MPSVYKGKTNIFLLSHTVRLLAPVSHHDRFGWEPLPVGYAARGPCSNDHIPIGKKNGIMWVFGAFLSKEDRHVDNGDYLIILVQNSHWASKVWNDGAVFLFWIDADVAR